MADDVEARWALVLPYREHMLAVARRRCTTDADAEDCVQDAMLRVAEFEGLDPERVGALLTSVTVRLAVDIHRARARARRHLPRLVSVPAQQPPPDEAALDNHEAMWLAAQVQHLPEREREVLRHRAAGYSAGEAAARLSLSYKAAESAFTRARGRMRTWAGAGALLVAEYLRRLRQRPAAAWASMAMVSAAVVLSSLSQLPRAAGRHADDGPAVTVPAPVGLVPVAAAVSLPLTPVQRSAVAAATAATRVAPGGAAARPAATHGTSTIPIASTSFDLAGQAYTINVVGYQPPGRLGQPLGCLERQQLIHADGTVGCPPQ